MDSRYARRCALLAATLFLPSAGFPAQPGEPQAVTLSAAPARTPILTVRNGREAKRFSIADLEAFGAWRVTTATFWPDDDGTYEGPLLRDVLKSAGIENAENLRVRARDGFSQILPRADWEKWPVILATRRDGKFMSPRDKGPLRIIYPRDMAPELADTIYRLRWVWLVESIEPASGRQ